MIHTEETQPVQLHVQSEVRDHQVCMNTQT